MSAQRKEILQVMSSDPAWRWTYAELGAALPHIKQNALRAQVSRLAKDGAVARGDDGSLLLARATGPHGAPATPTDTARNASNADASATHSRPPDAPEREHVAPALTTIPAYARVLDALPVAPLRATFRTATALAFVRSSLEDCEAPAVATCGRPGTGKTVLFRALSILLHGDHDAVMEARNLTSKQQVVGRRERKDGAWTATPSVLFEPPNRARPVFITLDEVGEKIPADVMTGFGTILRLEPYYFLEDVKMNMSALVTFSFNKPKGTTGPWSPFRWDGATRRILVCDLDHAADYLKAGAAKTSARRVFAALESAPRIDFESYAARVRYPPPALLETADDILSEVFTDPSELPLGDPVLRGLVAAVAVLFDHPLEHALLLAVADVATIVGTLPGLLKDGAEGALNNRLRAAGLPPVVLPKVEVAAEDPAEELTLSPAARARIAQHLASASTRSTDELLTVLCEYRLARRRWCWIRAPRWVLEVVARWAVAASFAALVVPYNLLSSSLKMPRVSGGVIGRVFAFAARGPATRLREFVDRDERPLDAPRDYVLRLFGDDLSARAEVHLEDAAKDEPVPYAA